MSNSQSTGSRATVLVVDDERATADLYTEYVADDYAVLTAYSGEEALDIADESVAVVLLDRKMPGLSGDEVLQRIRERGLDCRVVMVTGVEPDVAVLDLPFDDYLVKPASPETVRNVVSAMFVRNTYDDSLQELVALTSKMATIESKLSLSELEASAEYAAIEARFNELRAETELGDPTDDLYTEFSGEKMRALFS